jgi:hypothetical protein
MSNDSVLRPRGAPEGFILRAPLGDEEGSLARSFPAMNCRATIGTSLRDEEGSELISTPMSLLGILLTLAKFAACCYGAENAIPQIQNPPTLLMFKEDSGDLSGQTFGSAIRDLASEPAVGVGITPTSELHVSRTEKAYLTSSNNVPSGPRS